MYGKSSAAWAAGWRKPDVWSVCGGDGVLDQARTDAQRDLHYLRTTLRELGRR
jgi:hypothetical protein